MTVGGVRGHASVIGSVGSDVTVHLSGLFDASRLKTRSGTCGVVLYAAKTRSPSLALLARWKLLEFGSNVKTQASRRLRTRSGSGCQKVRRVPSRRRSGASLPATYCCPARHAGDYRPASAARAGMTPPPPASSLTPPDPRAAGRGGTF